VLDEPANGLDPACIVEIETCSAVRAGHGEFVVGVEDAAKEKQGDKGEKKKARPWR